MPSDARSASPFPLALSPVGDDGWAGDSSASSTCSSDCCSCGTTCNANLAVLDLGALAAVHRAREAAQATAPAVAVAVEGDITVERSKNVTIGPSTHVHVTVVQPPPPAAPATDRAPPPPGLRPAGDEPARAAVVSKDGVQLGVRSFPPRPCVVVTVIMGLAAAVTVAVVLLVLQQGSKGVETLANGVKLAKRSAWGALPPLHQPERLATPVGTVIVHHTATAPCFYFEHCAAKMRVIQNYHQGSAGKEDWVDIAYNFVVGGDGVVYEGRGWDAVSSHTRGWNCNAVGLAIIGNFTADLPTQAQRDMLQKLIQWGVEDGKIVRVGYRLAGACQVQASKSPGKAFMQDLRTWPGWWDHMWNDVACTE